MNFSDRVSARERLIVLQLLMQDADNAVTEYELKQSMAAVGQTITGQDLKDQLRWLERQWLVKLEPSLLDSTGMIVRITERGADVVSGAMSVDGIEKPRKEVF